MDEAEKKNEIIEPLWYIEYISILSKRNQKAPWTLIIPIFLPLFIVLFFMQIPSNILNKQTTAVASVILLPILVVLFYYVTRKYIIEKGLDIDRYSWVTFLSGRIGMELYRLSILPTYQNFVEVHNISLRRWLFCIAFDYRGDKSGKKRLLLELRTRLKSLPKFVKDNKTNSEKMFDLGKKFMDFGEYISYKNPEIRIEAKYLQQLIDFLPKAKPGVLLVTWNVLTNRVVIGFLVLLVGIITGAASYFWLQFSPLNSIFVALGIIPVITSIYAILTRK